MAAHAQLQFNQAGAWRGALTFDAAAMPVEFLKSAEDLVRLSGTDPTMRIVMCQRSENGTYKPTSSVFMTWTRKHGWAKA